MLRTLISLITLSSAAYGGWYAWNNVPFVKEIISSRIPIAEFKTLEIRYSAEEIMQSHKQELLKNNGYSFLEPKLLFYPYLLMDVKYAKTLGSTVEGILLWGLSDAEMVIQTTSWEKTHGFEDCLVTRATKGDLKIIEALVACGGSIDREKIYSFFDTHQDAVDKWVDSCREKKLIIGCGNKYRLHFQNPRFQKEPITSFDQPLVTMTAKNVHRIKGRYSMNEIKNFSEIAFGADFAIRHAEEVYLPVYALTVQNPDGSVLTTYWNALNNKRIQ